MATFIKCWGSGRGLLPPYPVKMYLLDLAATINPGDYFILDWRNETVFHNWVSIDAGSEWCGKTVGQIKEALTLSRSSPCIFGRKGEF